jgi:hypothetical protein
MTASVFCTTISAMLQAPPAGLVYTSSIPLFSCRLSESVVYIWAGLLSTVMGSFNSNRSYNVLFWESTRAASDQGRKPKTPQRAKKRRTKMRRASKVRG